MYYIIYDLTLFLVCLAIFVMIYKKTVHLKKIFTLFIVTIALINLILLSILNLKYHQLFNLILLDISYVLIYLELISILERGYSLNLLKSINDYQGEINIKNAHKYYSSKRGLLWLYEKRINSLLNLKIIFIKDNKIQLTIFGKILANILDLFIKILMIKRTL